MAAQGSLELDHSSGSTRVWLGRDATTAAAPDFSRWVANRRVFVLSSASVRGFHRHRLDGLLTSAAAVVELEIPDGESAKTMAHVERLLIDMVTQGGKRDSRLITLGGGSVGDLGGFIAGCFLRGIEYAQCATTLLAQVDASIGGKTGVNLPGAKNSVGLFHHPRWVVSDRDFLETLPEEELRQGMFEVVKAAVLGDAELFDLLAAGSADLTRAGFVGQSEAIRRAVAVKRAVVSADERESGKRRVLNLGHTLGHALETTVGPGVLRHGDAVGHGMLFAVRLAEERSLSRTDAERIRGLIQGLGGRGPAPLPEIDKMAVLEALLRDKKALESGLVWVLPRRIGQVEIVDDLPISAVEKHLASFL